MKKIFTFLMAFGFISPAMSLTAQQYAKRPRLVVLLVVDQMRADYLTRFEQKFMAAGSVKNPGGFRFLTQNGAWFPFAEYDILQCMTCTGHAMIATGTHPALNGIGTNDWYSPQKNGLVLCTEDDEFGRSPRRLRSTTFGDEIKNINDKSQVFSISLKDRSAIMLGGHRADTALWLDEKNWAWTSSKFYSSEPAWVAGSLAALLKKVPAVNFKTNDVQTAKVGTQITLDAALEVLKKARLGQDAAPDVLAISLSNHDILGHRFGPNSEEMQELAIAEDKMISGFLQKLSQQTNGFKDVVITLTADHGIPPTPDVAKSYKLDSGKFDMLQTIKRLNQRLDERFGSSGKDPWILRTRLFHFFLNEDLLKRKKLNSAEVQAEVKAGLLQEPGVFDAFTKSDYDKGLFPVGMVGQQIKNSYIPGQSGDVVLIAKPFFSDVGGNVVTHMTGWSYDRMVPIVFYGAAFKPGVYAGGQVVDIAPTLSFILGTLPPSMSTGRVLKEAF